MEQVEQVKQVKQLAVQPRPQARFCDIRCEVARCLAGQLVGRAGPERSRVGITAHPVVVCDTRKWSPTVVLSSLACQEDSGGS